jgi:hypothetical protein
MSAKPLHSYANKVSHYMPKLFIKLKPTSVKFNSQRNSCLLNSGAQTQTSFSNENEERNKFESLSDSYTNNTVDLLTRPGYKHFTKQNNPHDRGP